MFRRSLSVVAVAAAMLGAGAGFAQPAPQVTVNAPRRANKGLFTGTATPGSWWRHTYLNHGLTAAQQKRTTRKVRNVKRHKRAVRGAR